jgi:hypothetical protein
VKRIQRQRAKGWRMPAGAIYVGRYGPWGNPFPVGVHLMVVSSRHSVLVPDLETSLALYRAWVTGPFVPDGFLTPLRGHDLVCWCPLDRPCHADVLLELANA